MSAPIGAVYEFNQPGEAIEIFRGTISGLAPGDVTGSVKLCWTPGPTIEWSVDPGTPPFFVNRNDEISMTLHRADGDVPFKGFARGIEGGWSNGATFGSDQAPLNRIVAHWFNLPNWHGQQVLEDTPPEGGKRSWRGRSVIIAGDWTVTTDVRPDHSSVWDELHLRDVYVMTHVMEIRRTDGTGFTAADAEPLLTALHVGVSFALGRWAAPMLPVGQDSSGTTLWEDWRPALCDAARRPSPGWWYEQDHDVLSDFLKLVVVAFSDPDIRIRLRMQMGFAIVATGDKGFVEQRITAGFSGLEHLMWQNLVLGGTLTRDQYRVAQAANSLRSVLAAAQIPIQIDASLLPALDSLATEKNLVGPEALTWVRNRLMHPDDRTPDVYQRVGLLRDTWTCTRYYLTLLILHSVGFSGSLRDLRSLSGMASDTQPVPWV